jgi:hypothetical protein
MGVALFGAMAGDGTENVVSGLHGAAAVCVLLLLSAAALVFYAVSPAPRRVADSTPADA